MFMLRIKTTSDAFYAENELREVVPSPEAEVIRILREVADRMERGISEGLTLDINGNRVGAFTFDADEEN